MTRSIKDTKVVVFPCKWQCNLFPVPEVVIGTRSWGNPPYYQVPEYSKSWIGSWDPVLGQVLCDLELCDVDLLCPNTRQAL